MAPRYHVRKHRWPSRESGEGRREGGKHQDDHEVQPDVVGLMGA